MINLVVSKVVLRDTIAWQFLRLTDTELIKLPFIPRSATFKIHQRFEQFVHLSFWYARMMQRVTMSLWWVHIKNKLWQFYIFNIRISSCMYIAALTLLRSPGHFPYSYIFSIFRSKNISINSILSLCMIPGYDFTLNILLKRCELFLLAKMRTRLKYKRI